MRQQLFNCQSNLHWAKGTKNEAELRSDVLKVDVSQTKTRYLLGL